MGAFTSNPKTPGICGRCGFRVLLSELQRQVVAGRVTGLRVCGSCLDEDNPQYRVGRLRISDPQAVRDPAPPHEVDVTPSGALLGVNFVLGFSAVVADPLGTGDTLDADFWLDHSTTEPG
jgi:hypothetical protein